MDIPLSLILELTTTDKLTIRMNSALLKELKHNATDSNTTVTNIVHNAVIQYLRSRKITTFEGDDMASTVATLVFLFVKELRKITNNDETIDVKFNKVYVEVYKKTGSPSGIGSLSSENRTLKNRVYQELLGKEFIRETNSGKIVISYKGKSATGFE